MGQALKVVWSRLATEHLSAARQYIAEDSPTNAVRVAQRIVAAVRSLELYPQMGRPGRIESTRELVITGTPFVVPYRVRGSTIDILSVLHGARQWPDTF